MDDATIDIITNHNNNQNKSNISNNTSHDYNNNTLQRYFVADTAPLRTTGGHTWGAAQVLFDFLSHIQFLPYLLSSSSLSFSLPPSPAVTVGGNEEGNDQVINDDSNAKDAHNNHNADDDDNDAGDDVIDRYLRELQRKRRELEVCYRVKRRRRSVLPPQGGGGAPDDAIRILELGSGSGWLACNLHYNATTMQHRQGQRGEQKKKQRQQAGERGGHQGDDGVEASSSPSLSLLTTPPPPITPPPVTLSITATEQKGSAFQWLVHNIEAKYLVGMNTCRREEKEAAEEHTSLQCRILDWSDFAAVAPTATPHAAHPPPSPTRQDGVLMSVHEKDGDNNDNIARKIEEEDAEVGEREKHYTVPPLVSLGTPGGGGRPPIAGRGAGTTSGGSNSSPPPHLIIGSDLIYNELGADTLPVVVETILRWAAASSSSPSSSSIGSGNGGGREGEEQVQQHTYINKKDGRVQEQEEEEDVRCCCFLYSHTFHRYDHLDERFLEACAARGLRVQEIIFENYKLVTPAKPNAAADSVAVARETTHRTSIAMTNPQAAAATVGNNDNDDKQGSARRTTMGATSTGILTKLTANNTITDAEIRFGRCLGLTREGVEDSFGEDLFPEKRSALLLITLRENEDARMGVQVESGAATNTCRPIIGIDLISKISDCTLLL